ncbi:hypothetical protein [Clavibacter sp. VKM Ac-2872]|uniref:hypothetical protein n=1 Tax=Clavibacter sp. VKM Ac-2872 TaxID=2783812 RepID=UPI00188C86D2|nr:hypothetical protein [Clavibacter sp. VKM Ac-2872]MBF4625851.1 hypothetical protein [Clavibacter sp. VKM Ac-2872]
MSDTSPTGSPAGTPNEAYRLSITQQTALTKELRAYARDIARGQVLIVEYDEAETLEEMRRVEANVARVNNSILETAGRYTDLADSIEQTGELGLVALQSWELTEIADVAGWDDHSRDASDELRELAEVAHEARRAAEPIDETERLMERDEIRRRDNESAYYAELEDPREQGAAVETGPVSDLADSDFEAHGEALPLTPLQRSAVTYELRRHAELMREDGVRDNSTAGSINRYLELADTVERTGELGPDEIRSRELREIASINGWRNPSTPAAFREIVDGMAAAEHRGHEAWAAANRDEPLEHAPAADTLRTSQIAEALTFGIDGETPDANNARASAAEGQEPFGARQVVDHGGDLAAAVESPEFRDALQSELGPEGQGANAVETARAGILADLHERGAVTVAQRDPAPAVEERVDAAPVRDVPLDRSTEEERPEQAESGPRSVIDRIRAKLHLDSEARAERLSAVGITLRPQETSTAAEQERAQAQQPRAYGLEDTAR